MLIPLLGESRIPKNKYNLLGFKDIMVILSNKDFFPGLFFYSNQVQKLNYIALFAGY